MSEADKHRASKRSSKNGARSERRAAARHGGQSSPASGNRQTSAYRNDIRTETASMEWKYTDRASFTVKDIELHHAWSNAIAANRIGIFGIEFSSGNRWLLVEEQDYLELMEALEVKNGGHPSSCG
jgi:hypothetical protein